MRRSTSSAAWPGHCVTICTLRRRQIRVGVDRQVLERHDAPDREADHRHHDDEPLRESAKETMRLIMDGIYC